MRDFMTPKNRGAADLVAQKMMEGSRRELQKNAELRSAVLLIVGTNQQIGIGIATRNQEMNEAHGETMMVLTTALIDFAVALEEPVEACLKLAAVFSEEAGRLLEAAERKTDA